MRRTGYHLVKYGKPAKLREKEAREGARIGAGGSEDRRGSERG